MKKSVFFSKYTVEKFSYRNGIRWKLENKKNRGDVISVPYNVKFAIAK